MSPRIFEQFRFAGRRASLQLHVKNRRLSGSAVRTTDRGCEGNGRMTVQRLLDQLWIDVVPAADDQLLLAAGQPEIAVCVLAGEVAGVEPALAPAVDPEPGVVDRVDVTREDIRPLDRQNARLVDFRKSKKDAGFIQNHDCHVLIGKPQSHRPDTRFRVRRIDAGDAAALCQTIGFENSNSGFRFERSKQLRRHRRGAAVAELDARNVVRAERRLKEGRVNGRDAGEGVDPVVFDDRPRIVRARPCRDIPVASR